MFLAGHYGVLPFIFAKKKEGIDQLREERYKIKCPKHILFGDPLYLEQYEHDQKRLRELVVDYSPESSFAAGLILKEEPYQKDPAYTLLSINLYFAPEQHLGIYMRDWMYKGQKIEEKGVGVDTACYILEVDGRYEDVKTGGDGWWGRTQEFSHTSRGKKVLDAVVVTIWMPDEETFEGMKQTAKYLFDDLRPIEKVPEKKDHGKER